MLLIRLFKCVVAIGATVITFALSGPANADIFGLTFIICVQGTPEAIASINVQDPLAYFHSDSFSLANSTGTRASAVSASIDGGGLHAYSQVTHFGPGQSAAAVDLYVFDTFHIAGPIGQSATFTFNLTFDGIITTAGSGADTLVDTYNFFATDQAVTDWTSLFQSNHRIDTISKGLDSPFQQTSSDALTLQSGSTVVIGALLESRIDVIDQSGLFELHHGGTATIDNMNTGFFTVTSPLGFSYTTDSGLTYLSAPVPAPEPATLALLSDSD